MTISNILNGSSTNFFAFLSSVSCSHPSHIHFHFDGLSSWLSPKHLALIPQKGQQQQQQHEVWSLSWTVLVNFSRLLSHFISGAVCASCFQCCRCCCCCNYYKIEMAQRERTEYCIASRPFSAIARHTHLASPMHRAQIVASFHFKVYLHQPYNFRHILKPFFIIRILFFPHRRFLLFIFHFIGCFDEIAPS